MQTSLNPDEARRFAQWLEDETGQLMENLNNVKGDLEALSSTWNDKQYHEFLAQFFESSENLNYFSTMAEVYSEYLRSIANLADDYLD